MSFVFRSTFFLKGKNGGHSFSLFRLDNGHVTCLQRAKLLAQYYMKCLGVDALMSNIRVSREDVQGDSLVSSEKLQTIGPSSITEPGTIAVKAAVADNCDAGFTSLLVNLGADAFNKGRHFMRLIPDSLVQNGGDFVFDNNWDNAFTLLRSELVRAPAWGGVYVPKGPGSRIPVVLLTRAGTGDNIHVTCSALHNFQPNQKIRLGKTKVQNADFNGAYIVDTVVSGTDFTLRGTGAPVALLAAQVPPAYCSSLVKQFIPFDPAQIFPERIVERKNGRPFGLPVGRRRVRKK
jgi:hypothetical protein